MKKYINKIDKEKIIKLLFAIIILSGLLVSSYVIFLRSASEKQDDVVSVSVRFSDLVHYNNIDFFDSIVENNFQNYIDTIIVKPRTVMDLENAGRVLVVTGNEIKNRLKVQAILSPYILEIMNNKGINEEFTYIYSGEKKLLDRIENLIKRQDSDIFTEIIEKKYGFRKKQQSFYTLITRFPKKIIHDFYMEFDKENIQYLKVSGFNVMFDLSDIKEFNIYEFLKYQNINISFKPDYIRLNKIDKKINEFMTLNDIKKVNFEFENDKIPYPYIRGHRIPSSKKISVELALRRLKKAVRERKIRFIMYEFLDSLSEKENLELLKRFDEIRKNNSLKRGIPSYFTLIKVKRYRFFTIIIYFAVFAFLWKSIRDLISLNMKDCIIFYSLSLLAVFLIFIFNPLKVYMLNLIIAFIYSIIIPLNSLNMLSIKKYKSFFKNLASAFSNLFEIICYTMTGTMLLIPLFYSEKFLQGEILYRGVKLSLIIPVIILFLYFYKKMNKGIEELFEENIKVKHLICFSTISFIMFYYVLRSSNQGAAYMIPYEDRFRSFLEDWFVIRPRTKEFLLTVPAIFLLSLGIVRKKSFFLFNLCLLFILVGQGSVFNTYMHFHTPFLVSLFRTANGLILGIITGIIVLLLYDWFYILKDILTKKNAQRS